MHPGQLGRYRITGVIGRGGMGVVYDGHDPQIDRPVAIKTIALDALDEQEKAMFEARFRAEMRSAGRLQHHNIAALYDTGRDGGTAYIVMERVAGSDLKRHLAAGRRFTPAQALDIAIQLLAALAFAHRHHVIHRDVKPANVMLQDDGVVKLCDFGVARLADSDATRTQGMIVGSMGYASPEQVTGQPIDARTDIYATGVLLYELLTGELPFKGSSEVERLHRIAQGGTPSPRAIEPSVPPAIDVAVRRALARDPAQRFGSAAEFAQALGASTQATADTLPRQEPTWTATRAEAATLAQAPPIAPAQAEPNGRRALLVPLLAGGAAVVVAAGLWSALRPAAVAPSPTRLATAVSASAPRWRQPSAATAAPTPQTATARPTEVPKSAASRPPDGAWQAHLACGAVIQPRSPAPGTEAFEARFPVAVAGGAITWLRDTAGLSESVTGRFDAAGRFTADGSGRRKDRNEQWRIRAVGQFLAPTRRIEADVELLRVVDGTTARACKLTAEESPGSMVARHPAPATALPANQPASSGAPRGGPPPAPAPTPVAGLQGSWSTTMSCGPSLNPPPGTTRTEPYTAKGSIEVRGSTAIWRRESKTWVETASGPIDARGRFSADGQGEYKDPARRNPWRIRLGGEVLAREGRVQGHAQVLRHRDGSIARECSLAGERPARAPA